MSLRTGLGARAAVDTGLAQRPRFRLLHPYRNAELPTLIAIVDSGVGETSKNPPSPYRFTPRRRSARTSWISEIIRKR